MSNGELPTLSPPEYLNRKVETKSESELVFYTTELGLTNYLKRITPDTDSSKRVIEEFSSVYKPWSFVDPPFVRSEAWSECDFVKSHKKRRWMQFKSKLMSCLKSVKCRFTVLGLLLGLLLSLAVVIPIVVVWQTWNSASCSET